MLPDYISGVQQWEQLIKISGKEEKKANLILHKGLSIESIDRQNKTVIDNKGKPHRYDVLLLAMGSRATVLKDIPLMPGLFTIRSKPDADDFIKHIHLSLIHI